MLFNLPARSIFKTSNYYITHTKYKYMYLYYLLCDFSLFKKSCYCSVALCFLSESFLHILFLSLLLLLLLRLFAQSDWCACALIFLPSILDDYTKGKNLF